MSTLGLDDTIAAIATPPGRGAVALVRISGARAMAVLRRLCPSLGDAPPEPRRQVLLRLTHPETGVPLDTGLVAFFQAPQSFTGEDTVEIATHGGAFTPALVLDAALAGGARLAYPGEFTRRAHLNGKLDLLQAEAIIDLIDVRSPAMHRTALHQMERGLSRRIEAVRSAILQVEALVAYGIDFPDEDEPPVSPAQIEASADEALDRIEELLRTAPQGQLLREGALVVLAGRPNSGKSSLFNALLGIERSIVTDVPGTTRDAVESDATFDGYPFRLVDTAGIRATRDRLEALGIEVAERYLDGADIVLFCTDGDARDPDERAFLARVDPERTIIVRTKLDLRSPVAPPILEAELSVSAVTGTGIPLLKARVVELAFGAMPALAAEAPIITSERHRRALVLAAAELRSFLTALVDSLPVEIAAVHLRAAAGALEDLIGIVSTDDLLGAVFSRFCVGK